MCKLSSYLYLLFDTNIDTWGKKGSVSSSGWYTVRSKIIGKEVSKITSLPLHSPFYFEIHYFGDTFILGYTVYKAIVVGARKFHIFFSIIFDAR